MLIHNTLSGHKEEFRPAEPNKANIYVCGPTTYNFIHLGNARPLVVFDTVRRYLIYRGYDVNYVLNFTDVDDKIIERANEMGEDPTAFAARYIEEYFLDADALGILRADVHPRVSEHMTEIVEAVQALIDKGFAYEVDGDVYYRVRAFPEYGKLSKRKLEDMLAGARVEVDQRKEEAADFALWKSSKPGEPFWESPWGPGRPGWHIECSVMSTKYLGKTLDIHGGGSDLIFPHHENEIAQSEALNGQQFVKYWMHNGFITINSEKMSKSLGNFFILRDVLAKYPADVVRYYLIATHYRSPLDFDDTKLEEARRALGRLKNTLLLATEFAGEPLSVSAAGSALAADKEPGESKASALDKELQALEKEFIASMDDDFNTARALGYYFEMSRAINSFVAAGDPGRLEDRLQAARAARLFRHLGDVLGIYMDKDDAGEEKIGAVLDIYLELRRQAREVRDWETADRIRDLLGALRIEVQDGPEGSKCRYDQPPALDSLMAGLLELRAACRQKGDFAIADFLRDSLKARSIIIEDTKEGARWKQID